MDRAGAGGDRNSEHAYPAICGESRRVWHRSDEVTLRRDGDAVIIEPVRNRAWPVHTSPEALLRGETEIRRIGQRLLADGTLLPIT